MIFHAEVRLLRCTGQTKYEDHHPDDKYLSPYTVCSQGTCACHFFCETSISLALCAFQGKIGRVKGEGSPVKTFLMQ